MDMDDVSSNNIQHPSNSTNEINLAQPADTEDEPLSAVRPPPVTSPDPSPHNFENVDSSFMSQESYVPSAALQAIKASTEYQFKILQRQMQENKNATRLENQRFESTSTDISSLKSSVSKIENKLGPLQKMLASQTDRTLALKKDLSDVETTLRTALTDVQQKVPEVLRELSDLKNKMVEFERKLNSRGLSFGFQSQMPDNLRQMMEAYERQLGMCDVRIAELDSRFQVLESTSYNGVLVWKIKDYERRKREAISGKALSLYSQPFYTSSNGYKMCARIYLNGDGMGKGTHMSLFFVVMKGEYDALLPWPFRQKVSLMLLDQGMDRRHLSDTFRPDPTSSSFKRPTSDMNIASGCPLFVAHNVIDGSTYTKEDTIFVKIQVDIQDLENLN
ncbi:TNF receptor-associated factor 3-like [Clavelina lepadiformis]|uniref:MATH domain-containing protein n=1 Tax=Clavelina lepadiformis TaxID=159417 RepID=A0ABP0GTZ3_CLALP